MLNRIARRSKFAIERLLVRGAQYRLMLVACLIGLLSVVGGALVILGSPEFDDFGEAVWWAFLRLSDPGYLGDDTGTLRRIVSTFLTVAGYVVFLGALVAIMTQWLNATMRRLESGLTPVARRGHLLVLGWTNRTPTIIQELLLSEGRVRRFLRRYGTRGLHIVVLAAEVTAERLEELRGRVGPGWDGSKITLRSGSPLIVDDLERVDFANASGILIPGSDSSADRSASYDTRTIKTLLSLSRHPQSAGRQLPVVAAEIFDARNLKVARSAYDGPIEAVASDVVVSRLIAQNVRHPGLSEVYHELLTHGAGCEIYVRECPDLAGERFQDLGSAFPHAVPLGVARPAGRSYRAILNPPDGFVVEEGDRLAFIARSHELTQPAGSAAPARRGAPTPADPDGSSERRILIAGWNHKVPVLLGEFESYRDESYRIDVVSRVPVARRESAIAGHGTSLRRTRVRHLEADSTVIGELRNVTAADYDNIVVVAGEWAATGAESDARTIVTYLLLHEILEERGGRRPELLIELLDPDNAALLGRGHGEVIISPVILSHILAHVALRRELRAVFDGLFAAGGADVFFRSASSYCLTGDDVDFARVQEAAMERGETALGVRLRDGRSGPRLRLNPGRDERWRLGEEHEVVTLSTYD